MHTRLREALEVTRTAVHDAPTVPDAVGDLLVFCHGFCKALGGHHESEDRALFPGIEAAHPDLAPVLRALSQDHSMIAHLLEALRVAAERSEGPESIDRHLEGIAAIMESHFRYEERELLTVLEGLDLGVPVAEAMGPL